MRSNALVTLMVEKLTDAELDRQADYLKLYLYDQRGRLTALLERREELSDGLDGAWPADTGLDPDMTRVARALKPEGRHVAPTIRRVDAEPPSVLSLLHLTSPYPPSHWHGWREALLALPPRPNYIISLTVLGYYADSFIIARLNIEQYLVTAARREGLRAMVQYLHRRR